MTWSSTQLVSPLIELQEPALRCQRLAAAIPGATSQHCHRCRAATFPSRIRSERCVTRHAVKPLVTHSGCVTCICSRAASMQLCRTRATGVHLVQLSIFAHIQLAIVSNNCSWPAFLPYLFSVSTYHQHTRCRRTGRQLGGGGDALLAGSAAAARLCHAVRAPGLV